MLITELQRGLCPSEHLSVNQLSFQDMDAFNNWKDVIEKVKNMPVAEAESVRHSKWVMKYCGHQYWFECSMCGQKALRSSYNKYYFSRFCPNCGAKMEM